MVVIAAGFWLWLLERLGAWAITMPWGRVYIRREFAANIEVLAHEIAHLDQIARMGPVRFAVVYLYQWARYGYGAMPLEAEADRLEQTREYQDRARNIPRQ